MQRQIPPTTRRRKPKAGEPVWELARLFPAQGAWSEEAYLALDTGQLIEYTDGYLEILPMPTLTHQRIVRYLFALLSAFITANQVGGEVLFAPLPVRLSRGKYREPDIIYLSAIRLQDVQGQYPQGSDLVIEVVSGSATDRARDLVEKRYDYAQAGIPEYWIVDPDEGVITVLRLEGEAYIEHGSFGAGQAATSHLLPGFSVVVDEVWAAAH
jgi:Uma2 family endonuclease